MTKESSEETTNIQKSTTLIGAGLFLIILIGEFFYLTLFDKPSYEHDERIDDLNNEKEIKIDMEILEEAGYEVIYFGYLGENTPIESAYLEMKSLGTRDMQIINGLSSLRRIYPDAPNYEVVILEPTRECRYNINRDIYRLDSTAFFNYINSQIKEPKNCFEQY